MIIMQARNIGVPTNKLVAPRMNTFDTSRGNATTLEHLHYEMSMTLEKAGKIVQPFSFSLEEN